VKLVDLFDNRSPGERADRPDRDPMPLLGIHLRLLCIPRFVDALQRRQELWAPPPPSVHPLESLSVVPRSNSRPIILMSQNRADAKARPRSRSGGPAASAMSSDLRVKTLTR
jgi:hypothetical protein